MMYRVCSQYHITINIRDLEKTKAIPHGWLLPDRSVYLPLN